MQGSFGAGEGFVSEAGGLASLGLGKALALAVEDQVGVVDEGHAVGVGKLLGSGSDEVDVRTFFKDEAGGLNGIAQALDAGHAAGLHAASVHEKSVELDATVGGEKAAATGVESGIVFEDGHGGFYSVEGGAGALEDGEAGFEGVLDAAQVGGVVGWGDGPGTAMDEENGAERDFMSHPGRIDDGRAFPKWVVCTVMWEFRTALGLWKTACQ